LSRLLAAALAALAAFVGALIGVAAAPRRAPAAPDPSAPEAPDAGAPDGASPGADPRRSAAEWVSLVASLLLVGGLVGVLLYLHVSAGSEPAAIEARPLVEAAKVVDGRFYLPVEVHNRGDRAAEQIRLRVVAGAEDADLDLDRLAAGATARAVATLSSDPRQGATRVDVLGFVEP
jgi:uncharacterized protein (TIGR02588 family)